MNRIIQWPYVKRYCKPKAKVKVRQCIWLICERNVKSVRTGPETTFGPFHNYTPYNEYNTHTWYDTVRLACLALVLWYSDGLVFLWYMVRRDGTVTVRVWILSAGMRRWKVKGRVTQQIVNVLLQLNNFFGDCNGCAIKKSELFWNVDVVLMGEQFKLLAFNECRSITVWFYQFW